MIILIVGAGELGRQLAWTLYDKRHRVTMVDHDAERLDRLRERLDVMTVCGEGASVSILKRAGIDKVDLLLAVTGHDATNVLACQIGRHYGVRRNICRVASDHIFSATDGFTPAAVGIDALISPEADSVDRIVSVLDHRATVERIVLPRIGAELCAFRISSRSLLQGVQIRNFPDKELLSRVRFALLLRNQRVIVPTGNETFMYKDEVYAAGTSADVASLLNLADPESPRFSHVIVAGATSIARRIVTTLVDAGKTVRIIDGNLSSARRFMDDMAKKVMVIHGDPTESDVLEEAKVDACHAFVSTVLDDEDNILSCVLAKNLGALKVISVTNKAEYVDIVPAMGAIDCGFSPRLVAVNSVLSLLSTETVRVQAILQRTRAYVYQFEVQAKAPVCDRPIATAVSGSAAVLALAFRGNQLIPATGDLTLRAGDQVLVIARPQDVADVEPLFRKKGLLAR